MPYSWLSAGSVCRILFLCHGNAVYGGKVILFERFSLRNFCHVLRSSEMAESRSFGLSLCQFVK